MDEPDGAIDMPRCFRMEGDDIGSGLGEVRNNAVHRFHHQMHIDNRVSQRTNCLADKRPDGQIGHIVVIHHIKMDKVRAGIDHSSDFLAQLGKVCGKNARSDAIFGHEDFLIFRNFKKPRF